VQVFRQARFVIACTEQIGKKGKPLAGVSFAVGFQSFRGGNSVDPGREVLFTPKLTNGPEHLHKHFLSYVFGFFRLPHNRQNRVVDPVLIGLNQLPKRRSATLFQSVDEFVYVQMKRDYLPEFAQLSCRTGLLR
jgi:hypothetical protein